MNSGHFREHVAAHHFVANIRGGTSGSQFGLTPTASQYGVSFSFLHGPTVVVVGLGSDGVSRRWTRVLLVTLRCRAASDETGKLAHPTIKLAIKLAVNMFSILRCVGWWGERTNEDSEMAVAS